MSDIEKLQEMVNGYPKTIQDIDTQISFLDTNISDLNDQKNAIENIVFPPLVSGSDGYLTLKATELTGLGACSPVNCVVCTYGGYGVSNLTDWVIVSAGSSCPTTGVIVWGPGSTPSGSPFPDPLGPVEDAEQYQRQVDFEQAYGHINDPVGLNGTYGISANISNLTTGKTILENNKAKYENVLAIYSQYT